MLRGHTAMFFVLIPNKITVNNVTEKEFLKKRTVRTDEVQIMMTRRLIFYEGAPYFGTLKK